VKDPFCQEPCFQPGAAQWEKSKDQRKVGDYLKSPISAAEKQSLSKSPRPLRSMVGAREKAMWSWEKKKLREGFFDWTETVRDHCIRRERRRDPTAAIWGYGIDPGARKGDRE